MTDSAATLIAAVIAAGVAGLGLVWSIVSFLMMRHSQRAAEARQEWARRYQQALAQALSADAREAAAGLVLIGTLSRAEWATDEDRATAASVLASLSPAPGSTASEVRSTVIGGIGDRDVASELEHASSGPKGRFEVYRDGAGAHRWRLTAADGEVLAESGGHPTENAALQALQLVRRELGGVEP
ncbi:DUF1508 domain-containing protein [Microbacterium sp. SD291]|uniref:YegP family protein n=1 Tax=Microbacterium sp. SD291 TaxID=2782007 RepID=UPI001A96F1E7|nr:DUF1508 domain-containing protein [Microbacterium sp. SD291]MBO0980333.1 DUF1508 domain-containing protein [Microbacterium sp. SD291]